MLRRLWNDDRGAVISTELVIVLGVMVFGTIPGAVAVRNSVNRGLSSFASSLDSITPDPAAIQSQITPPPYAAKSLNHSQSRSTAAAYSVSGSHTNVYVNVQIPSRSDLPSP